MTAVIYARYSSDNQREESIEGQIRECTAYAEKNGITNMLNSIQMGTLTSSTKERLEALEDQRKELQARIAEERLAKPKMKEEFVRFWLLRFRKLDMTQPEQRQALVDTFINAIYLYDDKVLITFNYKEGTETVAFGEAVKAEKSSDFLFSSENRTNPLLPPKNDPLAYADLILNGDPEEYLKNVTGSHRLEI